VHPLAVVTGLGLAWWLGGPVAGHFRAEAERRQEEKNFLADVDRCMASDMFPERFRSVDFDGDGLYGTVRIPSDWQCRRWARYEQKDRTGKWWFEENR
jgi:hypothetical protein